MAVSQKKRCGSVLVELGHGLDLDEAAEVQLGHGGDEAAGLVRAEEFGVDLVIGPQYSPFVVKTRQ